jgi:hypothetical protein
MKVKIGNTVYSAEDQPVMVILSEADKANIAKMLPECTRYCAYPDRGWTTEQIFQFMEVE